MAEQPDIDPKARKKAAKAEKKAAKGFAKAAKKQGGADPPPSPPDGKAEPDRALRAAEQKVTLERWRTVIAGIGVIIALVTLLVMMMGGA